MNVLLLVPSCSLDHNMLQLIVLPEAKVTPLSIIRPITQQRISPTKKQIYMGTNHHTLVTIPCISHFHPISILFHYVMAIPRQHTSFINELLLVAVDSWMVMPYTSSSWLPFAGSSLPSGSRHDSWRASMVACTLR